MKKLLTICLIMATIFTVNAQNAPLNKQETLDYIEKVFKSTYQYNDVKILGVSLDGKILNVSLDIGINKRRDLSKPESIEVTLINTGYTIHYSSNKYDYILWAIQAEADAKRLKKALEHLIEILKTEKNTDPFGE